MLVWHRHFSWLWPDPPYKITVLPRNLAMARFYFYFKAPFGAATIRGRRLPRSTCVHSFSNKPSCMHLKCPCAYRNWCWPLTMRRDFEGGIYWDELADRCGDISRAAGFWSVARFRGNTVCILRCCSLFVHSSKLAFWLNVTYLLHGMNKFMIQYTLGPPYLVHTSGLDSCTVLYRQPHGGIMHVQKFS